MNKGDVVRIRRTGWACTGRGADGKFRLEPWEDFCELGVVVGFARDGRVAVRSSIHAYQHPDGPTEVPELEDVLRRGCFHLCVPADMALTPEFQHLAVELESVYDRAMTGRPQ